MVQFNKIELGEKLKEARNKKGYSAEYVAHRLGKSQSTISRYEIGEIIPDAITLKKLCDILEIYYDDIYKSTSEKITNKENSINPFRVNRLYLYYLGFRTKNKVDNYKLIIDLKEKSDYVEVKISYYDTKKIILKGHIISDSFIAIIRTENYKPNYPRLEANQIVLDISSGMDGLIRGTMLCTNDVYKMNLKKVVVSKKDLPFNDEILNYLKLDNSEKKKLLKTDIWQANVDIE